MLSRILFVQLILLSSSGTSSAGAEFTVNSAYDVNDLNPGDGNCVAYISILPPFVFPFCTLRAAIEEANSLPGPDIVNLGSGTYRLELEGRDEDKAKRGDLDITSTLLIKGAGADKTFINGNKLERVFDIGANAGATLQRLSVTNGNLPSDGQGGGIRNQGRLILQDMAVEGNTAAGKGGGVFNSGNCTLKKSTIKDNQALNGGGIFNSGTMTISASTINNNRASSGGGLSNEGNGLIVNSTVSGNRVDTALPGGGIYNISELDILQSTIAHNSSPGQGGGISNTGNISMINTIIAANTNTNCVPSHPISSAGYNLEDADTCTLRATGDIIATDPKLDSLGDHGGPTLTHGLFIGSPAVDRGRDLTQMGISTDQRGVKRPAGDGFDIGAFETKKRSVVPLTLPLLCCGGKQ